MGRAAVGSAGAVASAAVASAAVASAAGAGAWEEGEASLGGGLGGGSRGGGTLPPTVGMIMVSQLIINFCGDCDSWDMRSLSMAWAAGARRGRPGRRRLGGGGLGGGGGFGGGGFRTVPPAGLASAVVRPGQTRKLPTRLVSLSEPPSGRGPGDASRG